LIKAKRRERGNIPLREMTGLSHKRIINSYFILREDEKKWK